MKNLIKKMSEEQKQLKKARKTGPYEIKRDPKWCYAVLPEHVTKACAAASQVRHNAVRITAALNLYHEIRGSSYRHNVLDHLKWQYDKELAELKALEKVSDSR